MYHISTKRILYWRKFAYRLNNSVSNTTLPVVFHFNISVPVPMYSIWPLMSWFTVKEDLNVVFVWRDAPICSVVPIVFSTVSSQQLSLYVFEMKHYIYRILILYFLSRVWDILPKRKTNILMGLLPTENSFVFVHATLYDVFNTFLVIVSLHIIYKLIKLVVLSAGLWFTVPFP